MPKKSRSQNHDVEASPVERHDAPATATEAYALRLATTVNLIKRGIIPLSGDDAFILMKGTPELIASRCKTLQSLINSNAGDARIPLWEQALRVFRYVSHG